MNRFIFLCVYYFRIGNVLSESFGLKSVDKSNGLVIAGTYTNAENGYSVSGTGDINGDGYNDVIIGEPNSNEGTVLVVFGGQNKGDITEYQLTGTNGFRIYGETEATDYGFTGGSVSFAGDVNSDGIDDIVIGAYKAASNTGYVYVIFGSQDIGTSNQGVFYLSDLDGTNGFKIEGILQNDFTGFAVSSAGDLNNDKHCDFLIGAYNAYSTTEGGSSKTGAGKTYVIFGGPLLGGSGLLLLNQLNGHDGFVFEGNNPLDYTGYSIGNLGDFNGDGIDDVIIGSNNWATGQSYVVFGNDSIGNTGTFDLGSLNAPFGFEILGTTTSSGSGYSGRAVSGAGDFNGDGYQDAVIGAPYANGNGDKSGEVYIVYGGSNVGISGTFSLDDLDGANGIRITGYSTADYCGTSVSSAGDINGDGYDDVIIGAPYADVDGMSSAGEAYIVYGGAAVASGSGLLHLSDMETSTEVTIIRGRSAYALTGASVSGVGDVNGDGTNDIVIGAYGESYSGKSYILYNFQMSSKNSDSSKKLKNKYIIIIVAIAVFLCFICIIKRHCCKSKDNSEFALLNEQEISKDIIDQDDPIQAEEVETGTYVPPTVKVLDARVIEDDNDFQ